MGYSFIRRASRKEREQMAEIVASHNELLAIEGSDYGEARYERVHGRGYWMCVVVYEDGTRAAGSFVRCQACGAVSDLWEGQIEGCPECEEDWEEGA